LSPEVLLIVPNCTRLINSLDVPPDELQYEIVLIEGAAEVVTFTVLLAVETFPAASFALT
jgi:hypothetical protein